MGGDTGIAKLSELVNISTGKLDSNHANDNGEYPFFTCAPKPLVIDKYAYDCDAILLAGNNANGVFHLNRFIGKFNAYQRTYILTNKNSSILDLDYLFYSLKTLTQILSDHSLGTATKFLTMKILLPLEVKLPPLPKQKAIAHILGSLDDKIELNRQINQTLESMAQALFKSWFVDFDPVIDNALAAGNPIPDVFAERSKQRKQQNPKQTANPTCEFPSEFEFVDPYGWIPKGWGICRFNKIVDKYIDNRGKTPPLSNSGIPLIEVKHLPENSIKPNLYTSKYVNTEIYNSWFRAHLKYNDIIISTVGTIGRICLVPNGSRFVIAQNILGFRFDTSKVSPLYMYYQMDGYRFRHDVDARLVTTVQASIKRKDLETIDLLCPTLEVQEAFEKIIKPYVETQNSDQSIQLSKLRDTLLPKLLSGELRIPDAEKLIKDSI